MRVFSSSFSHLNKINKQQELALIKTKTKQHNSITFFDQNCNHQYCIIISYFTKKFIIKVLPLLKMFLFSFIFSFRKTMCIQYISSYYMANIHSIVFYSIIIEHTQLCSFVVVVVKFIICLRLELLFLWWLLLLLPF